jgi:predicted secreted protein
MTPVTGVAIFITVWWTVLFAVLPWGVQSHHEAGVPTPGGGDPAAPVNPNMKRKFLTTTWISVLVFLAIWALVHFGVVPLPNLPSGY